MLIKFKIDRHLRFLSHSETMSVFQRACVRAGINLRYSQGFNPRPKLSLPLPRSVGVESDDELLVLKLVGPPESFDADSIMSRLSDQLPDGCRLLSVQLAKKTQSFGRSLVTYVFEIAPSRNQQLKTNVENVLASESLRIKRRTDARGNTRIVDVRGFLNSVEFTDESGRLTVECAVSSAGSIRIDEILELLQLRIEDLAAPIRRTKVQWLN